MATKPKVDLDSVAAYAVHQVALSENRSLANAANRLIREAWSARQARTQTERAAIPTEIR